MPQSSKMAQKLIKLVKFMMQTKVHWCLVFNSFFVFHSGAQHRKHKKKLTRLFQKFGLRFLTKNCNCSLNVLFVLLKANFYNFFSKICYHIFKTVFFQLYVFLCQAPEWYTKKLLKTEHQCTFVYIMNFYKLLSIFTMFFRDTELCLERCDSYGGFGYLTKSQTFLF